MKTEFAVVGLWLAALTALAPGPAQASGTLLVIGDSLSDAYGMPREAGWAHLLADRLGADYAVVNASISGETSFGGRQRLPDLIARHRPDWLLIILGGNDGLRALSPAQLASNLGAMIEHAQQQDVAVALMQIRLPANLGPAYIGRFERVRDDAEFERVKFNRRQKSALRAVGFIAGFLIAVEIVCRAPMRGGNVGNRVAAFFQERPIFLQGAGLRKYAADANNGNRRGVMRDCLSFFLHVSLCK